MSDDDVHIIEAENYYNTRIYYDFTRIFSNNNSRYI